MKSIVSMRRAFSQEVWHQGPVRKQTRPIRHCEQSEAIQTWAAHLRLSLDCFAALPMTVELTQQLLGIALSSPERTVSHAPVYQMLWLRGFGDHTILGRGFNLFKPLRRYFRAGAGRRDKGRE